MSEENSFNSHDKENWGQKRTCNKIIRKKKKTPRNRKKKGIGYGVDNWQMSGCAKAVCFNLPPAVGFTYST